MGVTSDDPGPGQQYALEARQHITALRAKDPNIQIEIRWCPSYQEIEGNETAHEWAKLAADEPDAHGVGVVLAPPTGCVLPSRRPREVLSGQAVPRFQLVEAGREALPGPGYRGAGFLETAGSALPVASPGEFFPGPALGVCPLLLGEPSLDVGQ